MADVLPAFEHAKKNSRLVAVISGDPAKRAALRDRRRRWPTLSQEIHEPAVSMPEPVHAPAPSVR
jgi:hypothetical protein